MPLFSRSHEKQAAPTPPVQQPQRRSGLFSNRHSVSSNGSASTANSTSPHRKTSLLSRHNEDPSIHAAREQVRRAELAEKEADKALISAKNAVHAAREHVRRLEQEAAEE